MKYYFLGSLFSEQRIKEIKKNSIGPISNANNLLQNNIIFGLANLIEDLKVVTLPNIGAYPKRYKKHNFSSSQESMLILGRDTCYNLGFLNLPIIKHISRLVSILKFFRKEPLPANDKFVFYVYDLELEFLLFIYLLKKKYNQAHVCLIAPDLPGMTGGNDGYLEKVMAKFTKKIVDYCLSSIDSFSFISQNMIEKLDVSDKPFTVVEGIYRDENCSVNIVNEMKENETLILFYSGALDERNGILNLISAFKLIDDEKYKLHIAGEGPLKEVIVNEEESDTRIVYFGQVDHEKVLSLQSKSHLLINPRQPVESFTRYSFPSKTMEYFASGIPTLMYRLPGVPTEYFNYCTILDDLSITALSREIVNICEIEYKCKTQLAVNAREFIFLRKNPIEQSKKLIKVVT